MNHKNVCVQYVRSNFTSLRQKSWSCFNYSYREFPLANSVFLWHQRHLRERWFDSCTRMKDCYDTAQLDSWMPPKTEWPLVRNEGRLIYVSTREVVFTLFTYCYCFTTVFIDWSTSMGICRLIDTKPLYQPMVPTLINFYVFMVWRWMFLVYLPISLSLRRYNRWPSVAYPSSMQKYSQF